MNVWRWVCTRCGYSTRIAFDVNDPTVPLTAPPYESVPCNGTNRDRCHHRFEPVCG